MLAPAGCAPDAAAFEADERTPSRHDQFEPDNQETDEALELEISYTGEFASVASGGVRKGARYLDNLLVSVEADLDALGLAEGTSVHVSGLYNNGSSISELAGDAFAVSNIETGTRAARLYEAWVEKSFASGTSVKLGLYDLNSEFDHLEPANLFIGSSHGIGAEIGQTGLNGPSIFPATSLALRIEQVLSPDLTARAAVLDGVPGSVEDPGATRISLSSTEGALGIVELDGRFGAMRLLLGHWRYSALFDAFDGARARGNAGSYVRAETILMERRDLQVEGFARFGTAASRFNMFSSYASAGIKATNIAAFADEAGIAIAYGRTSQGYRNFPGAASSEMAIEATFSKQIAPWFRVQPSLQYIIRPSADRGIDNAIVPALRFEFSHSF